MKKGIIIEINQKSKNKIEALAKLANKVSETRYYLRYLKFEILKENSLRISATNGFSLIDLNFDCLCSGFADNESFELHSDSFLKLEKGALSISFNENEIIIENADFKRIGKKLDGNYPEIELVRFKSEPTSKIYFSFKELQKIAKSFDSDDIFILFDESNKLLLKNKENKDTAVLMQLNGFNN